MVAFLTLAAAHLHTTQGTYEDHHQVSPYASLTAPAPQFWTARGLTRWTIWAQARSHATPAQMRAVNLALACCVSLSVGYLAYQLGLTAWIAAGVMLLHPMATETIAALSGRAEMIAVLGVVLACVFALRFQWALWRVGAIAASLSFGYLGKETALIGLVLVPLAWSLTHRRPTLAHALALIGGVLIVGVAWWMRNLGLSNSTIEATRWAWTLHQGAAAFRGIALFCVPIGQTVDPDLDAWSVATLSAALGGLIVVALLAIELWRSRFRIFGFGLAWALAVIVPRLIIMTPRSYLNDHQLYPALVGLALIVAAGCRELEQRYECV